MHGALQAADREGEPSGVSAATMRRRLSIVSGFFAFLQARGDVPASLAWAALVNQVRASASSGGSIMVASRRQPRAERGKHAGDVFAQGLDVGFVAVHEVTKSSACVLNA